MLFTWDFEASAPEFDALDAAVVAKMGDEMQKRLETQPNAEGLARQADSLELVFHAAVKNRDEGLLAATLEAVERVDREATLDGLENVTVTTLGLLNLQAWQRTQRAEFEGGARRALDAANARWDEPNAFFKANAGDTSNVFYTDANARLGEMCYLAWRMLNDPTLRPKAGEILGKVSDAFDANAGLYQVYPLPEGTPSETDWLEAYTAAIRMFLTASKTTERGTYVSRACIVANYALTHWETMRGGERAQVRFASALLWLAQFQGAEQYRDKGLEILRVSLVGAWR